MHISPLRKNIPLTVVTLAALGIMFFLFFMHPSPPEESLEFYAPDGNIAGSFRVEITNVNATGVTTGAKSVDTTILEDGPVVITDHDGLGNPITTLDGNYVYLAAGDKVVVEPLTDYADGVTNSNPAGGDASTKAFLESLVNWDYVAERFDAAK